MILRLILVSFCLVTTNAFTGGPLLSREPSSLVTVNMGGSSGYASTREGKKEKVHHLKELLDTSQMVFAVPTGSITVTEVQNLRRSLPKGSTATVVKNTLMDRVLKGTEYEAAASLLKGSNMWFFIDEDVGATIKAWDSFVRDSGRKDTHQPIGGVMEGTLFDSEGVDKIGKLPSKDELYAKIAVGIKQIPTRLARVIKEPNAKLARAVRMALMPEDKES